VVATVKQREARGWSFEAADASLELLMRSAIGPERTPVPPFTLESVPGDRGAQRRTVTWLPRPP